MDCPTCGRELRSLARVGPSEYFGCSRGHRFEASELPEYIPSGVEVQIRVVNYDEDGEPSRVSHNQMFTPEELERFGTREFAENVVSLGAEAVFQRFREENPPRLKFAHGPASRLLSGQTDTTIRYDLELDLSPGDVLELVYAPTGDVFARAKVVSAKTVKAHDALSYAPNYSSGTLDELIESLNHYYDEPIEWESWVTVVVLDDIEPTGDVDL